MMWGEFRTVCVGMMAAVLALVAAGPVSAQSDAPSWAQPGSVCRAVAAAGEDYRDVAGDPSRWNCSDADWPDTVERVLVRFDRRGIEGDRLSALLATTAFDTMAVRAIGSEGDASTGPLPIESLAKAGRVWQSRVDVPHAPGELQAVVVTIDGAKLPARLESLQIVQSETVLPVADRNMVIAALLCGLLFAPILFDIGFFRVLRERFPLYHAAFAAMAVVQTFALGGLLPLFFDVSRNVEFFVANLSFDLMAGASALFAASFIEREKLSLVGKRILQGVAGLAILLGITRILFFDIAPILVYQLYYGGYLVFMLGLAVGLSGPLRQGSIATWFLIASYLPLIAIGAIRIGASLASGMEFTFEVTTLQHLALGWQVVVSAFAVAERFMSLKRERDQARAKAMVFAKVSERDTLTGLHNRRMLEQRFDDLRAQGFTTIALIDLDHFKSINDRFGHAQGDAVLRIVGKALQPDEDMVSVRLGGEEFLILLSGNKAAKRAERLRVAIGERVAAETDLPERLTASMGLVEAPLEAMPNATFEQLYSRADRLLYDAKMAGRDRTISEKLKVFHMRQPGERRVAA